MKTVLCLARCIHTHTHNSASMLISSASEHNVLHISIKSPTYLKQKLHHEQPQTVIVGKERSSLLPLLQEGQKLASAGRDSHPESPRMLCEGYLHIFCASVAPTTSGDFSSQS